jgi:hypothetical protein
MLGFAPREVKVGLAVYKVAPGQVFSEVLRFSPVSIIPPLLHINWRVICGMDNGPVSGRSSTEA